MSSGSDVARSQFVKTFDSHMDLVGSVGAIVGAVVGVSVSVGAIVGVAVGTGVGLFVLKQLLELAGSATKPFMHWHTHSPSRMAGVLVISSHPGMLVAHACPVGILVGAFVGAAVGAFVGDAVGETVVGA